MFNLGHDKIQSEEKIEILCINNLNNFACAYRLTLSHQFYLSKSLYDNFDYLNLKRLTCMCDPKIDTVYLYCNAVYF